MKTKGELLIKLQEIQQEFSYQDSSMDDGVTKDLLIRLSGYQRTMDNLHRGGSAVVKTGDVSASLGHARSGVVDDLHGAGLGLAVFDFLQIPSLYLYAYLLGYKLPFTWGKGAQWSRSALLLGLSLTCLLFPPAALIIAFVTAGIALVSSAFFLVQVVSELKVLAKKKMELDPAVVAASQALSKIQKEASELVQQLEKAEDPEAMANDIDSLHTAWKSKTAELQDLQCQLSENKQLTEKLGGEEIRERCARVFLASSTVIGLVTSIFFPPVGLAILAGTALFGAAYFLVPSLYHLGKWMGKKTENTLNSAEKLSDEERSEIELSSDCKIQRTLATQPAKRAANDTLDRTKLVHAQARFSSGSEIQSTLAMQPAKRAVSDTLDRTEPIHAQGRFSSHPVADKKPETNEVKDFSP